MAELVDECIWEAAEAATGVIIIIIIIIIGYNTLSTYLLVSS
jgi:hypothetical protein